MADITLGKKLLALRTCEGLTQEQMAAKLHTQRRNIINWENDKVEPSSKWLRELAYFFDVSVESLIMLKK